MIVDTIRNGKSVTIEVKDNRIVAASVDLSGGVESRHAARCAGNTSPIPTGAQFSGQVQTFPSGSSAPPAQSLNGKPVGQDLDFALAIISAIRHEHWDDPMVNRAYTCQEIAELTYEILGVIGRRGCTKQNISRIEQRTLRKVRVKLYCAPELSKELETYFHKH